MELFPLFEWQVLVRATFSHDLAYNYKLKKTRVITAKGTWPLSCLWDFLGGVACHACLVVRVTWTLYWLFQHFGIVMSVLRLTWQFQNVNKWKDFHIRSSLDTLCTNPMSMRLVWKIPSVFVENACTLSLLKSTFLTCIQFLGTNWVL